MAKRLFASLSASRIRNVFYLSIFIGILVFAYLAYVAFTAQQVNGFIFLALAGILLTIAVPPAVSPTPTLPDYHLNLSTGRRYWVALCFLLLGIILLLDAARIFAIQLPKTLETNGDALTQFCAGLILWIVANFLLTKNQYAIILERNAKLLLLILIAGVALFLRVYLLDVLPTGVWYDEAIGGLLAQNILHNPLYRPIFAANINITFPHIGLYALMLSLFGETNITAMRLVSVAFGVGAVIMGYVVGHQLRGHWFGLLMAAVLATMHWAINFSRIAMTGIEAVFFILLAFAFIIRLIRYGQLRDAVWAGLSIGAGLWFYRSFQIVLLPFGLFILVSWRYRPWRKTIIVGLILALNVLVVIFPIIMVALTRSEYFDRVNVTSIFGKNAESSVPEALARTIPLHLEMFHIKGDANGRHNLPNAPMLDPLTGIAFGLGLIYALRDSHKRESLFFYILLLGGLSGGILTLPFEAPQSLRSIDVLPAVAYFAALGASTFGQFILSVPQIATLKAKQYASLLSVCGLTLVLTLLNYDTYFQKQRFNYFAWKSFSTFETLVGRILAQQDDDTLIFASPYIFRHVSTQFLTKAQTEREVLMKMPDALPVLVPADKKVIMFFVPIEKMLFEYAKRLYPNATFHTISLRDYGIEPSQYEPDLFYTVELRPEDVAAIQGLAADGSGIFYAPEYQLYQFVLSENTQLTLDGHIYRDQRISLQLERGEHTVEITPPDAPLSWVVEDQVEPVPKWFLYHTPITLNGVRAAYYPNANWEGDPVTIETHPFIYQRIQILPRKRPYSVTYTGELYAPVSGDYVFRLTAIDYAKLSLDGEFVLETVQVNKANSTTIKLTQGWHSLEVRRKDISNNSFVFLEWTTPGSDQIVPVPRDNLRPTNVESSANRNSP